MALYIMTLLNISRAMQFSSALKVLVYPILLLRGYIVEIVSEYP